jgi:hypothetical protein
MQKKLNELSRQKNTFCSRDEKCNINSKLKHKKSQELKETLDSNNKKMQGRTLLFYLWQGKTFCAKLPTPKNEAQKDRKFKPKERGS